MFGALVQGPAWGREILGRVSRNFRVCLARLSRDRRVGEYLWSYSLVFLLRKYQMLIREAFVEQIHDPIGVVSLEYYLLDRSHY